MLNKPTIFKTKENAINAADVENPYGYYGKDACRKITCMECGKVYYGYLGSDHSDKPACACGVNDMWKEEKI